MNDPSSVKKSIEEETREISIISKLVFHSLLKCVDEKSSVYLELIILPNIYVYYVLLHLLENCAISLAVC